MMNSAAHKLSIKDLLSILFIFTCGFFFHWYLKFDVIITNSDDLRSLFRGFFTLNSDSDIYQPLELANKQGRFYFFLTDYFSYLPYFFEGRLARSGFIAFIYCLSGLSISYILYKFTRNFFITKAFLILFLSCIPIYSSWYAYYHWPLYWHFPFIFFAISIFILSTLYQKNLNLLKKITLYLLYLIFSFAAIIFSEMYFMVFGFILALFSMMEIYEKNKKIKVFSIKILPFVLSSWKSIVRVFFPYFIYLSIYFSYLLFYAAPINRVSQKLAFNLNLYDIFISIKHLVTAAFPLNFINFKQSTDFINSVSTITADEIFIIFLVIVLSLYVSKYFVKLFDPKLTSIQERNLSNVYPIGFKIIITFLLGYLFISIHVLTGFYQNWLTNFRPWYTPAFHLSISFLIISVFLIDHFSKINIIKSRILTFNSIIIFIITATITINTISSFSIRQSLVERNVVWHFMYKIKSINQFESVFKSNDSLLFPQLPFSISPSRTELLTVFLDKNLTVYPDIHEKILKYDWEIKIFHTQDRNSSYLVAGKPVKNDAVVNQFNEVWIVPYNNTKSLKIALTNQECFFWKNKELFVLKSDELFQMSDVLVSHSLNNQDLTYCLASAR